MDDLKDGDTYVNLFTETGYINVMMLVRKDDTYTKFLQIARWPDVLVNTWPIGRTGSVVRFVPKTSLLRILFA